MSTEAPVKTPTPVFVVPEPQAEPDVIPPVKYKRPELDKHIGELVRYVDSHSGVVRPAIVTAITYPDPFQVAWLAAHPRKTVHDYQQALRDFGPLPKPAEKQDPIPHCNLVVFVDLVGVITKERVTYSEPPKDDQPYANDTFHWVK